MAVDELGGYRAVLPVPLRRKRVLGIHYAWVVHQPFFCQYLAIFCRDTQMDLTPFFALLRSRFRYGSVLQLLQQPPDWPDFVCTAQTTQVVDTTVSYPELYNGYAHDRKVNLRRACAKGWQVVEKEDPEPLITMFRENHAPALPGGVATGAYALFKNLTAELQQRQLGILRYAVRNTQVEAGALFVREGNQVIYLFNAASAIGRKGHARTLLIDQMLQQSAADPSIDLFDFESPVKSSIRAFYARFGTTTHVFWRVRWNGLSRLERFLLPLIRLFNRKG